MSKLPKDRSRAQVMASSRKAVSAISTFAATLGLALGLASCAITTPVAIASTTGALPAGHAIELAPAETSHSTRARFATALEEAFRTHSVAIADGAPAIADFAFSSHDATSGVADPARQTAEGEIPWESHPRKRSPFDKCSAQRLRATLLLLSREDGSILYRGVGEADVCELGDEQVSALAEALVSDALASGVR